MNMYEDGRYLENNEDWHAEFGWYKAEVVQKILDKNKVRPSSFVEVGCGSGEILSQLSERYPDAHFSGYDISPQAHALGKSRETERVKFALGDFLQTSESYDCLLCMDVFEHVPDYLGFLERLRHRAKVAVFHIPLEINLLSILRGTMLQSRREVGHLHYFNRDTAIATLSDCGYTIVDAYYSETFRLLTRASLKNKLTGLVYSAIFALSKNLAVSLLGECSLIVLARADDGAIPAKTQPLQPAQTHTG